MDILTNLEMSNRVRSLIVDNMQLLEGFEEIYIFGSILCTEKHPRDIDILLIYDFFKIDLIERRENIGRVIEKQMDLPVDITMLSCVEKEETHFMALINNKFEKII